MIETFGFAFFGARMTSVRAVAALALLALLGGCGGTNIGSLLSPTPAPAAQGDAATAASATPAVPARSAPAGRSAQGAPVPQEAPHVTTPEEISAACWMSLESNKKVRDIDQRMKLVDKCIEERTKAK